MLRHTIPRPPAFPLLQKACAEFQRKEDPTYRVAVLFIENSWRKPKHVADGIGVLLLVWNKAFYNRRGSPNWRQLTTALERNCATVAKLRTRSILTNRPDSDYGDISRLFESLVKPLSAKGQKTPVGIAKALHLLAPGFLPIWDRQIARGYRCAWSNKKPAATRYLEFVQKIRGVCEHLVEDYSKSHNVNTRTAVEKIEEACSPRDCRRSLVKLVDEYNFLRFSRRKKK